MRTSKKTSKSFGGAAVHMVLAAGIAGAAVAATTNSVSLQDVSALTNTRTSDENRWLAHLVSVPTGSDHAAVPKAAGENQKPTGVSAVKLTHVMGVQTSEALHILDKSHQLESGETARINRAAKGDRIFKPVPTREERLAKKMIRVGSVVTGSTAKMAPSLSFTPKAGSKSVEIVTAKVEPNVALLASIVPPAAIKPTIAVAEAEVPVPNVDSTGRVSLSKGQMAQARTAARAMAKVVEQVKKEEVVVAANPAIRSTTSSYALAVNNAPTQMASAFAAVLRPTLKKSEPKKNRSVIRLSPGDHKWAALPLPKKSYSRAQRRCLAAGIYFEARGESVKGQQAVAQVILNRVKNPAYPRSICGVVYQNKRKRNACQFSFACDGIRDKVSSRKHWRQATNIANDAIDGKFWLRSVGSSSHYHADYVWPRWRKKMRKMVKIGRHIFYRTYGGGWS